MKFPELKIPQAVDVLADSLEKMIFSGIVRPETYLPSERKFSEDIGVSRTTLRDAMSRLRAKGLLFWDGNRHQVSDVLDVLLAKTFSRVKKQDADDLYKILQKTAVGMAHFSEKKANAQDRRIIVNAAADLLDALREDFPDQRYPAFYNFVLTIVEANYNFFGIQVVHSLLKGFQHSIETSLSRLIVRDEDICVIRNSLNEVTNQKIQHAKHLDLFFVKLLKVSEAENTKFKFIGHQTNVKLTPQEMAYDHVSKIISDKKYAIGALLPTVKDLSLKHKISENAIKLALHQLEVNGFIVLEKRGRARIVSLEAKNKMQSLTEAILRHPDAIEATFEFRLLLEEWICETTAIEIDDKGRAGLAKIFSKMERISVDDFENYTRQDIAFHKAIAKANKNSALSAMMQSFWIIIEQVTSSWLESHKEYAGNNTIIHSQHCHIYDAIIKGEGKKAAKAMRAHLFYVLESLRIIEKRKQFQNISDVRESLRRSQ